MVELAIAGNPAFAVSRIEVERGGASYSVDTLEAPAIRGRRRSPGSSSPPRRSRGSRAWREPDRILALCRLAVVPRGGYDPLDRAWVAERFPGREDRVTFLPGPLLPISGSVVRRRAAVGRSVRYLVPDAVARYIADHQLYTPTPPGGPRPRDRSRPHRNPAPGRPAGPRHRGAQDRTSSRSTLPGASWSSRRTRRPPTSCCWTWAS